jgi:hypothetical protein
MVDDPNGFIYQIKIDGRLRESWSGYFANLELSYDKDQRTVLTGPVADQVALRGILCHIWDLNLEVISVNRLQEELGHE